MQNFIKRVVIKEQLDYKSNVNSNKIITNAYDKEDEVLIGKRQRKVNVDLLVTDSIRKRLKV